MLSANDDEGKNVLSERVYRNKSYDDSAFRYAFKIFNENNNKLNKASDEEKNKNE